MSLLLTGMFSLKQPFFNALRVVKTLFPSLPKLFSKTSLLLRLLFCLTMRLLKVKAFKLSWSVRRITKVLMVMEMPMETHRMHP